MVLYASGCQRLLIGSSLGQVGSGDKTKLIGITRGPHLAFPPTFFCGRNRLVAQMREMITKRGDYGRGPIQLKKWSNFTPKMVRNKISALRSKNPEQGNL